MEKKIKLSYLLLGLGIGILVTSTLYSIFPKTKYIDLDNDIIIEKAKDLGMVSLKESIKIRESTDTINDPKEKDITEVEFIDFVVNKGDTLENIANKLFEKNLIEDIDEFIFLAEDKKLDTKLNYGTFRIKNNTSYSSIIKILTD